MKLRDFIVGVGASLALAAFAAPTTAATVYEATGSDDFGTINLTTGAYTHIGNMGQLLSGLASYGSSVYGGVEGSANFYKVNTATGALILIGASSEAYEDTGSTTNALYEYGKDENLYKIDPATGASTLIGNTGIPIAGIIGMSSGGAGLFITQEDNLYSINTTTGAGTLIGTTTDGTNFPDLGAMVSIGGKYYGGSDAGTPLQLFQLNTATGAVTDGALETSPNSDFWGLAVGGVPEPASWSMLLIGLGCAGAGLRMQRRQAFRAV
jgi:hypothetical protein